MSDVCLSCGYSLSGLPVRERVVVCPECGERNDPLRPVRRGSRYALPLLWIVNFVPIFVLGAGFATVEISFGPEWLGRVIFYSFFGHVAFTPALSTLFYASSQLKWRRFTIWQAVGTVVTLYLLVGVISLVVAAVVIPVVIDRTGF